MASNEKEWQQIKEEITCSICGDLFTDPRTIPCLHTFCKRCIQTSIESNKKMVVIVCCPLCRAPLPRDGIESIPANFTINRLVEIFKKHQSGEPHVSETICGNCENNSSLAVTWCMNCEQPLCYNCNEMHKKLKGLKLHKTIPIVFLNQSTKPQAEITSAEAVSQEFCMLHTDQTLDLYCQTCSNLICRDCTLKDHPRGHRDHDFDFVDEVVFEEREKIKQVTASLKQLLERVRNGVEKIECCEKQVDIESEANIEKIRATYGEVYKLLKQQQEEAIGKVNTIKTSFKQVLTMQKENVKLIESQLVSCDEFSDRIAVNRTRQILTYNKWIENRVDELTKQVEHANLDPECKANFMIVRCCNPVEFVNHSVCDVFCLPCLPDCAVSGPVVIDGEVKVTVTLRDIFGFFVVNQGEDLEICCNKEREILQNTHVEEESRGQYHIWYNPKRKEDHSLSIYWRGFQVNQEEIKVMTSIRDYDKLNRNARVIEKYGPANRIHYPYLLAKGPNSELVFYDSSTKQLVIFNKHFQCSRVISGAGRRSGKFQCITGIALDKNGHVYVADCNLHCIQKFKLNGEFISQFGIEGTKDGELNSPDGLIVSQTDLLFVCDKDNHRIQIFKSEQFNHCFGQHGTEPGSFNQPVDLTLNKSEDQLFITDCYNHRVQVFTPQGQFLRVLKTATGFSLKRPVGIHFTPDGHLLISSYDTNRVLVFEEDGKFTSAIEGIYQGKKRFKYPRGVLMMDDGQIIVACSKLIVF